MNVVEPLPEPEQEPKPTTLIEIATLSALAVSILCLLLFAWLASEMREGDTLKFDAAVRGWVHQFASPTLTRAMIFISLLGYDDISRNVSRTWSICLRRTAARFFSDAALRRLILSQTTRNRSFLLSLPRLLWALRSGAMRYGVFVWQKP